MFNIEQKINDAPHLHEGRRFAEEDNSQTNEIKHIISPFLTLTATNDYQLLTSIKCICDLQRKNTLTGTNGNYTLLAGMDNTNGEIVEPIPGMTFSFIMNENRNGVFNLSVNGGVSHPVVRNGNLIPNGTWVSGLEYTVVFTSANEWNLITTYSEYLAKQLGGGGPYANETGNPIISFTVADALTITEAVSLGQMDTAILAVANRINTTYHTHINPNGIDARITNELFNGDTILTLLNEDIEFIKSGSNISGKLTLKLGGFTLNFPISAGLTFSYDYRSKLKEALDITYQDVSTIFYQPTNIFTSNIGGVIKKSESSSGETWVAGGGVVTWYAETIMGFTGVNTTDVLYQANEVVITIPFTMKLNKE